VSPLDATGEELDEVYPPKNFAMVYQGTSSKKKPQNKNKKGENTLWKKQIDERCTLRRTSLWRSSWSIKACNPQKRFFEKIEEK
jgi:hypothetical protein